MTQSLSPTTLTCSHCHLKFTNNLDQSAKAKVLVRCPFCHTEFFADIAPQTTPPNNLMRDTGPMAHLHEWPTIVPDTITQKRNFSLQQISLRNVRCMQDLLLSFDDHSQRMRHWTLLLGKNGTGKTTLLRVIALLSAGSEAFAELLGRPEDWIRVGAQQCKMEITLQDNTGQRQKLSYCIQRGDTLRALFEKNKPAFIYLDELIATNNHNFFIAGYGCTRRLSRITPSPANQSQTFRSPQAQCVGTLFSPDVLLYPIQKTAIDLDYDQPQKGIVIIKKMMHGLLKDMDFLRIDKEKRDLVFQTDNGEMLLSQLSDGYQTMVAWCGDLLYRIMQRSPTLENPLEAYGILLIDEIDLHLHPLWQRILRQFINDKLPNFQIIASTHSPLTAQQAEQGELFVFQQNAQHTTLEAYPGIPRYLTQQELLTGPAFGVPSLYEPEMFTLRENYRQLRDKSPRSQREEAELILLRTRLGNSNSKPQDD